MSAEELIDADLDGVITTSVAAYERDVAHAVALERNGVIDWLASEARAERLQGRGQREQVWRRFEERAMHLEWLAQQIRNGAHNPQTPTSGDSRGSVATLAAEGTPRPSTDTSGPETADSRWDDLDAALFDLRMRLKEHSILLTGPVADAFARVLAIHQEVTTWEGGDE